MVKAEKTERKKSDLSQQIDGYKSVLFRTVDDIVKGLAPESANGWANQEGNIQEWTSQTTIAGVDRDNPAKITLPG